MRKSTGTLSSTFDIDALGEEDLAVISSLDVPIEQEVQRARSAARHAAATLGDNAHLDAAAAGVDPVILLELTKIYKRGRVLSRQDVRAVDSVTLTVPRSSCLALVGHNGAGLFLFLFVRLISIVFLFFIAFSFDTYYLAFNL